MGPNVYTGFTEFGNYQGENVQNAAAKIVASEAAAGGVGVYAAAGGFNPDDCAPPTWSDAVLYNGAEYVFTVSSLSQLLGIVATALTIIYFSYQIISKILTRPS